MDKEYILELYNNLGGESSFGKYSDFEKLITTDVQYQKDFHSSFGKETLGDFKDFSSLVQKKNSNSTGSQTPKDSQSKATPKPSTSVGGKQPQVKPSDTSSGESDLINKFGLKPGEKIEGVERKAYEAKRNQPKPTVAKKQDVVETKSVSKGLDKKLDTKYETISKVPSVTEKIEKGTKLTPDELITISQQQDLVINQSYNPEISKEKLNDELNEYQFLDGISEGMRKTTNKFFLQPITDINSYFGGNKDFTIKKGVPLAKEKEEAEINLINKGITDYSKEDIFEEAKKIFLKNDELSQKKNATDSYFSSLTDGHQVQRELEIKLKADYFSKDQEIKKNIQLFQVNEDRIDAYNKFLIEIDNKGFATDEDKEKGKYLFDLATKASEENKIMRKSLKDDQAKLDNDKDKLELLKYNYNDLDKTRYILNNFFKETIGGALKLIGETRELAYEQTIGRLTDAEYVDPLTSAGDYIMNIGAEYNAKQPEFRMMTLDDVNNFEDFGSYFAQVSTEQAGVASAFAVAGPLGLELVSAGSGGSKIKQLEDQGKQPFGKQYTKAQKVLTGWAYYGAEKYSEKFSTFKYLEDMKMSLKNISSASRELSQKSFKKELGKMFGTTAAQTQVGGLSESSASLANSLSDIYLLGEELSSDDIAKAMKESYTAGILMDGGTASFGALSTFASKQLRAITDNKDINKVRSILDKVNEINTEIKSNLLLTESDKTNLDNKANELINEAVGIVTKSVDNIEKLSVEDISKLLDINKEQSELKSKFDELKKSAMSSDLKKEEYTDLNNRFKELESRRNDILAGTFKEFNYLPEEESTKLKIQAAEELKEEAIKSGIEEDKVNIKEEDITKRAIENYEKQPKETTAEKPIEEGPTGQEGDKGVVTAQGQEGGVIQEEKNSVDELIPEDAKGTFLADVLDKVYEYIDPISGKTLKGNIFFDGQEVVFTNGNNEFSLGSIQDVLSDNKLNATEVTPNFNISEDGSITILQEANGIPKGNIIPQGAGLKAIKTDKEGNVKRVVITDSNGVTHSIKGELANDLAEVMMFDLAKKGGLTRKLNSDEKARGNFNEGVRKANSKRKSKNTEASIQGPDRGRITPKTEEDAIQKQSTGEGVLRQEQSEMGLQEVVEGDQESKVTTEEIKSEEEVTKIKTDLEASKERLNKAFNQYRNVNIAFDPKNQLAKDKELVKALLDYAYNNIRLGKYNAAKLIEDLAKDGIEITRDGAKYIFDRASKRVQREVNKAVGVKPKSTEQKRINKAYSIGVADQKVETQKQKDKTKEVKAEVSELKNQIKDIFSSAKEAMKNQTDRAKTIKGIKKQISDFIKDNLSNFDPKDINKSQQKALLNALVAVDDVNFEEVLGDVLDVFEGVESKKEENINKAYDKLINKIIKPSFYTVSEGKVKKTKITDKYKQKIKEAIDKFSKIKNPTTKQKEDFINEMSDLKNKGVQERNSIDEKIKDDKQRKASRVAIDLLNKNKSVLPETTLDTTNELAVDDAFALGGVIFDGIVYPNTLVGKSKFKEAAGKGNVKVKPYKAFKSTRTDKQISIKERIKRFLRGSALRNFGLASFNLALKYDKSSAEFIEENFDAPMRRFATDRIKIKSIFTANRNKFFFDLGIDLKKSKSQLAQYIKGKKEVMFPSKKDGGIFLFINHPTMFKLDGKDVRYADVIADFDKKISEEKDQAKKDSILAEKEKFELKYKSFEGLRDEHIVDLFNMIRQPDGLGKFLNNYTEDVALMVADYVNSNPGLRKMADKAIDLYKPVAKQMNPVLDKLGYDTFNDKKYSKKEDEIAVVNNSNLSQEEKDRRIEKIEKEYRIFNAIYPEGIPEFIPYYPISAETEVSTSDDAKFFEDGATNDYSLVFPNLITRKSGGSLVFGKNGILNKYEMITDDATNFIVGHEIMGLSQELFTGTSGSLLKDKLGEGFVSRAKTEVLNVLKNKSAGESVSQIIDKNPLFKFVYKTQGLQTAGELLINFKSALFQLAGVSVTYAKNPSALKLIPNLILTKEGRKELAMAYNLLNSSQELTDRINHKKDSAEVKILETIDKSNNTDLSFATALVHDFMVLTTYADYLSILLTAPVYINKANEYAKKNQGVSKASALIQTIPSFFADEINTTLQSNDSYYMGSNFKNGLSLLLGIGKYVQAPRQLTMLSVNEIADAYNNRKSIADASGKVFMYSVVGVVLTKLLADSAFGDDEDEEKLSEADKETKKFQQLNEIANSLLISSGLGGEFLATLKDFYLANERPEILGFKKPKGDLNAFDYFNLIAKNNFKNISVPLRNLDAVLDNREIYSNTDQALAALQFGTGTPLFKLKKHSDYLTALAKQELTYREYWKFFTNQYKITEFKKIETEMNRYSKILEISYRKYSDPKNKILNDNFLNSEERKMMSGMSNEEKVSFLENVRLNKIAQDFTLKYQEQMNMLKENKNVSKFFDVRKARFEENMTEEVYKLIENKVKYVTGGISEEDALLINKEVKSNVLNSKDEFKTKENLSDSELDAILESVANKVNKKVESEYADTSAKMLKEFTSGKKKARAVYNLYKFAKEKGIESRYMQVISEELDDKTLGEFGRIIKEEGL